MNEQFFLKPHMAKAHIEMQRSGIEMALNIAKEKVCISRLSSFFPFCIYD